MEFGAHLPLDMVARGGSSAFTTARQLLDYAQLAEEQGFAFISANDHIVFRSAWLDGPRAWPRSVEERVVSGWPRPPSSRRCANRSWPPKS